MRVNALLVCRLVVAPAPSPAAITANPSATVALAPARRASRSASAAPTISPPINGSNRMPAPMASAPRTAWKYCGTVNSNPNIANDTTVARIVPQVKLADLNSDRSTSGWPAGRLMSQRSQPTNATSTSPPASIAVSAPASPQPCCPASIAP